MKCKHPGCDVEFTPKHRRHYFCNEKCKYTHHNHTEAHLAGMRSFNRSSKGKTRTKRFLQTEKGRRYNANKAKRQRQRYPDRCNARILASKILGSDGICSMPGCNLPGEKHHPDYTRPLEIVYLCKSHHSRLHQEDYSLVGI